jgi:hypothetical protein
MGENRCLQFLIVLGNQTAVGAVSAGLHADLRMDGEVIISKCDLVADLHLVEQPVRIALKYLRKMYADVASGLAKSVHDPAQGRFVNAKHSRQTVLPDARGVHPQL